MDQSKSSLLKQLETYSHQDYYPFHMPGHKRQPDDFPNPWSLDITEIEGFDNLHHAEGVLRELQEDLAELFRTRKSYILVNGSTSGILSSISACVKPGGKLLMSRNCHKSAYHCLYLRNISPVYLMPDLTNFGILGSLNPELVKAALNQDSDIQATLVTSPTYDGALSDIREIAAAVHARGIPLIVDEAHGAHLQFSANFPLSALSCGADVVIQSLHKTLPAFTQTAVLHLNSDRIPEERLQRFLRIYQSSSPSYLLMASADYCHHMIKKEGRERFSAFRKNLDTFYDCCKQLKHIHVLTRAEAMAECYDFDDSKILITADGYSGQEIYDILLEKYHLQLEMAAGQYALALTSLMDRQEGFMRLVHALTEMDKGTSNPAHISISKKRTDIIYDSELYLIPEKRMEISDAWDGDRILLPLQEAKGHVSGDYLFLYPPGIPLVAPGEVISPELTANIRKVIDSGLLVQGLVPPAEGETELQVFVRYDTMKP